LLIVGLGLLLVKPFGPVQLKVAPAMLVVAVKFKELPLQMGLLLLAVTVIDTLEATKLNGPTEFELHPPLANATFTLEYVPATKLEMVKVPLASVESVVVIGAPLVT
jgi:hypothetical protein